MDLKRLATAVVTIIFAVAISAGSASAAEKDEVVAAVNQYLANLDKPETMCDAYVSIIDEFPPHEWHGPTACADWWKAYNAYNDKSGITDTDGKLGTPLTVDVNEDRAYFVAPFTYSYKLHGKPVKETASFAVTLRKTQAGWRITGWAYSKQTLE